ncbi:Asp-tRNA(Asn)/Glu-tRNA(Gln) amidotransferase subunit GatC [soil metagenome]
MSEIDRSVVERVAGLARIALTEEETERFTAQLSHVLEAIARLSEVDTSTIPPTASVLPLTNVMRPDEIRPSLPVEEVFLNAPSREGDYFRVQTVLEAR